MIVSTTEIEVRYYETDLMGIVHHSNHIRYFECGRHHLMIELGLPINELEAQGIMMPVLKTVCNYKTPAKMGDVLRVVSRVEEPPRAKIVVKTEIFNQNNELICNGEVALGFINAQTRRAVRPPQIFNDIIDKYFFE